MKKNKKNKKKKKKKKKNPLSVLLCSLRRRASSKRMADDYGYPSYGRGGGGKSYEPFR